MSTHEKWLNQLRPSRAVGFREASKDAPRARDWNGETPGPVSKARWGTHARWLFAETQIRVHTLSSQHQVCLEGYAGSLTPWLPVGEAAGWSQGGRRLTSFFLYLSNFKPCDCITYAEKIKSNKANSKKRETDRHQASWPSWLPPLPHPGAATDHILGSAQVGFVAPPSTVVFWFPHAQHPQETPANGHQVPGWASCQGWWWA